MQLKHFFVKIFQGTAHLDFGSVLPSSPKQAQPTQQDVCVGTETDGLHRVGRVTPTTTVTCNIA